MFKRYSLNQFIPPAMSAVLIAACSAEVPPPAPEGAAHEDYVAGTRLYLEKLSETSTLELWDQGDDGVLVSVSGHNEYDADKEPVLREAAATTGSSSIVSIYRRLRPEQTEIPSKLLEIERMVAEREAAPAPEPQQPNSPAAQRPADDPADKPAVALDIREPDLPRADESPWTWMALWFRDTFCYYPGNEHGVCWLDGIMQPYAQQTGTGARHIITANTDYADIRFRGWGSGCQFWCSFSLAWDIRVPAGQYRQYHWLNSTRVTDRRGRIDPWNTAPDVPLIQFSMNWSSSSGGSGCRQTGSACSKNSDCCLTTSTTMCVSGVCKNDPTPGTNCDWSGEFCCFNGVTSDLYCNRTADPNLSCNAGTCRH